MKYVAFLDILGFKDKLRNLKHTGAKDYIGKYSTCIYNVFMNTNLNHEINGYIVSDSVILYSKDTDPNSLKTLIKMIKEICRSEFTKNGILIRGAIAKGEFDKIPATELPKLQKQLIVGQAYVDAYLLENSVKVIGINLSQEVYQDIINANIPNDIFEEKNGKDTNYLLRCINMDFLLCENNLFRFIKLAQKSKWLPHYYNTIHFALKNEKDSKKIEELLTTIESVVYDGKPSENWRQLDDYIQNVFSEGVIDGFKQRFLKHIRHHLTTRYKE